MFVHMFALGFKLKYQSFYEPGVNPADRHFLQVWFFMEYVFCHSFALYAKYSLVVEKSILYGTLK